MRIAALLLLLCSCAALNTVGMSDHCKSLYDACLNSCHDAPRVGESTPPIGATPPGQINFEIAGCTDDCNKKAKLCK